MMCGNGNLRTMNLFVRKLIMCLFFVSFILINGDIGVHGYNSAIAAKTLSAPNVVHFQMPHEDNSIQRPRRHRRQQKQHILRENVTAFDVGEFQSNDNATSTMERKFLIDNESSLSIVENRNGYENNANKKINENGEKILSRRRRYLIFPPGSSVQIVYDTYHPILGYSNYLIMGITAALAWELPYKPVYLDDELRDSYEMGNLPLLKRKDQNVSKVNYTSTTSTNKQPSSNAYSNYYYTNVSPPNKNPFNRYDTMNPNQQFYPNVPNTNNNYANDVVQSNKLHYYLSYANKIMKQLQHITQQIPKDRPFGSVGLKDLSDTLTKKLAPANDKKFKNPPLRNHLVHPVFKRRSIDKLDELEKYDLKLHRTTRHKLYQQIEKFLKTQGSDGMDCVLKTLCETGQRDTDEQPGSMIVELLRVVFTLPEGAERVDDPKHRMYDRAHQSKQNCHEMFPACVESIWGPKFHY